MKKVLVLCGAPFDHSFACKLAIKLMQDLLAKSVITPKASIDNAEHLKGFDKLWYEASIEILYDRATNVQVKKLVVEIDGDEKFLLQRIDSITRGVVKRFESDHGVSAACHIVESINA
ncbi:hypothetical protein VpasPP24_13 [Vibrio phage Vpas_PP24]|nr:hypothetical protein VpasPP24_13 [Vibrio phage Vpas_PP24]